MKKIILTLILIPFIASGCTNHKENNERPIISGVQIKTLTPVTVDEFYETSATVKSQTSSVLSSRIMGEVTSIKVKEGDYVKAGQLLLTLDSRDIEQKAIGAQAGVNEALKAMQAANENRTLANKTYERYKNLYNEQVVTGQEFDQIQTQKNIADIEYQRASQAVERATAGLGEVSVYRGYAKITAPISGIVVEKNIDLGSTAAPGQPLLTIQGESKPEMEAYVNESYLNKVKADPKTGIIAVIPRIDPVTRTFKVKFAATGLNPGQYVKVKIPVGQKQAILVPQNAVVQKGQLTGVYTVDDENIVSYRLIRAGSKYEDKVEVLSGLNKGDKVIISGVDKAVDGGVVK